MSFHFGQELLGDRVTGFRPDDGVDAASWAECRPSNSFASVDPFADLRWREDGQATEAAALVTGLELLSVVATVAVRADAVRSGHSQASWQAMKQRQ